MANDFFVRTLRPLILLGVILLAAPAYADGDPEKGEKLFKRCKACHQIGPEAKNGIGPNLTGVVGRPMGSGEGYNYGNGLQAAYSVGGVWDEDMIIEWLANPMNYIRSFIGDDGVKTKMNFKLKSEQQRKDVAAYLATFSVANALPSKQMVAKAEAPNKMIHSGISYTAATAQLSE